jgi:protein-tyrosine phosphatase
MDALIAAAGADPNGFSARWLNEALLRPAEIVLGMTVAHRSEAVELWPRSVRRAFTLKELARLLSGLDPTELPGEGTAERLRAAVAWAATQRRPVRTPGGDDVLDPYRQGDAAYAAAFAQVQAAVEAIGAVVAPVRLGA